MCDGCSSFDTHFVYLTRIKLLSRLSYLSVSFAGNKGDIQFLLLSLIMQMISNSFGRHLSMCEWLVLRTALFCMIDLRSIMKRTVIFICTTLLTFSFVLVSIYWHGKSLVCVRVHLKCTEHCHEHLQDTYINLGQFYWYFLHININWSWERKKKRWNHIVQTNPICVWCLCMFYVSLYRDWFCVFWRIFGLMTCAQSK